MKTILNKIFLIILNIIAPPLSFLYCSYKKLALIYFIAWLILVCIDIYLIFHNQVTFINLILPAIAIIHVLYLTRKNSALSTKQKFYNKWWGILSIPFSFVMIVFLVRSFLFEPFAISSSAMLPSLQQNEMVIINKIGYGTYGTFGINLIDFKNGSKKPERADIIAFEKPDSSDVFLMRVIGLPGDKVTLTKSVLSINGEIISQYKETDTIKRAVIVTEKFSEKQYEVQYTANSYIQKNHDEVVPENSYFVMGDNRNESYDSRFWGYVSESDLMGKVVYKW